MNKRWNFLLNSCRKANSRRISTKLKLGDTMLCRKVAKGRFTIDVKSGRTQHLLLATVTGIAPFVSYARTMYKDWKNGGNPMPGNHKLYCLQGGSRSRGIRIPRRARAHCCRSALVQICHHHQPSVGGRCMMER
jgi:hypothetical protein